MAGRSVVPVLVMGAPRSGTTLIGNFIGSSPDIYNVGEYRALFATRLILPNLLRGYSPPSWDTHRARYLQEVQQHAIDFVRGVAEDAGCAAYCDSSPRNALVADQLAEELPDAVFVLMLRHYSGVVQSLARSGWDWAGSSWLSRAGAWVAAYEGTSRLPPDRTVAISYDNLCAEPAEAIDALRSAVGAVGLDPSLMDVGVFGDSHAQSEYGPRPTVLTGGTFRCRPSFDAEGWSPQIEAEIISAVQPVEDALRQRWPETYRAPVGWTGLEVSDGPVARRLPDPDDAT